MLNKRFQQGNAFLPYLTLVVIAGLIMLNLWLYFWSQKELAPSKNQPVTTTTDPLNDWQMYTNAKYGFSLKYPSNWVAKEIPNQEYNGIVNFFQSGTKTYPELGGSQPIGENVVTLSLLKNPDDLTLQQIFNNDYNKCLQEPNNDFGCPRPQNTEPWQTITVDGAKAWRTGDIGIPEGPGADTLYIKQDGYYIKITLMFFQPDRKNIDTAILDQMISTFRFTDDMSNWKTYTDNEWNLTFKYPGDWKVDGQSQEKSLSIIPPDVAKKTGIELTPTMGIRAVTKVPNHAPSGTTPEKVNSDYDCNQNYRLMTINGVAAQRQDESCFATIRSTYLPKDLEYLRIAWPEVFEKDYPQFEKILSTFRLTDSLNNWKTYTNTSLGFSIQHPVGWKVDDTSTPNKVWFNKTESEAVDSVEVRNETLANWITAFKNDISTQTDLTIDGYPARQINLNSFNLQMTAIEKGNKLYIITSNRDIKKLELISTFHFTK